MMWIYRNGIPPTPVRGERPSCVACAISNASNIPYLEVVCELKKLAKLERGGSTVRRSNLNNGFRRITYSKLLDKLGAVWTEERTSFEEENLPISHRLVVSVPNHLSAIVNGEIHDLFDPRANDHRRFGYYQRRIYGWWLFPKRLKRRIPT